MKKLLVAGVLLAVLSSGGAWYWMSKGKSHTGFAVAEAKRGRLESTVGSTGTLQPREIVDVGAQVAGRIVYLGTDTTTRSGIVDWGSEVLGPEIDTYGKIVKPGTLLAQIDPSLYEAAVLSGEATVASTQAAVKAAEAAVDVAKADLEQKTATLNFTSKNFQRVAGLIKTGGIAQQEYDQTHADYGVAAATVNSSKANIEVAQAKLKSAQADVRTAEANLKTARTNLNYTTVTAPVKGIVIDRRINVGQTVVASLSAPSLFLIAKDLSKTEVWATVNEVDVGKIKLPKDNYKNVSFTVDACPGRVFHGQVVPQGKLPYRLNATMTQNVVTYTVVVSVDDEENKDGALRPYMTVNLTFLVDQKDDALMVPNAALRWKPTREQIAPDVREAYSRLRNKKRASNDPDSQDRGIVWVKGDDNFVRYIEVKTGLSDTVNTEIVASLSGGELQEHTPVIVGETRNGDRGGSQNNPFVATPFGPSKKKE